MKITFRIALYMLMSMMQALNEMNVHLYNVFYAGNAVEIETIVNSNEWNDLQYQLQWLAETMTHYNRCAFRSYDSFDVYANDNHYRVANHDAYTDEFTTLIRFYDD